MDPRESAFLQAVMGPSGAQALAKAPAELASAVMPRCILAWLGVAAPGGYEGQIPGLDGSAIQFSKGEGAGYCGEFSSQPGVAYTFDGASLFHLAGAVAVSLGTEVDPVPQAADLALLGKSVDAMVKAHVLGEELRRRRALSKAVLQFPGNLAPAVDQGRQAPVSHINGGVDYSHLLPKHLHERGWTLTVSHNEQNPTILISQAKNQYGQLAHWMVANDPKPWDQGGREQVEHEGRIFPGVPDAVHAAALDHRALSKAEPPGQAAPQMAPEVPKAPTPTLPKPSTKKNKLPKSPGQVAAPTLRITKSQARWARCTACKGELFKMVSEDAASWRPAFMGCQCYAEGADAVRVLTKGEQVTLEFDPAKWDDDAVQALLGCLGE